MKYYMAPLEEVTGYVFRNAYHRYFYPFDKYFAPFVAAKEQKGRLFNYKERNDILPENNRGLVLIPQILTNNSEAFIRIRRDQSESRLPVKNSGKRWQRFRVFTGQRRTA